MGVNRLASRANGLVTPLTVNRLKLLELTERGISTLELIGIKITQTKRNGSLKHRYWRHKVKLWYQDHGYTVEEEKDGIDIVASKGEERIAVGVETGKSDIRKNIINALKHYPKLIIVPTNLVAEDISRERISKLPQNQCELIEVISAKHFVK